MAPLKLPDFDDLPKVDGMPQGTAWGVFDKDGKKDPYGTLNIITPDVTVAAAKEVRDGVTISLNWPLNSIKTPGFGRKGLVHKTLDLQDSIGCSGFDDEVEFNTQSSSQWDSLVHFHHQATGCAYNGVKTNLNALIQNFGEEDKEQKLPTLNHWHKFGGMATRGVFIDFKLWADKQGRKFNPFDADQISLKDIEQIAKETNVDFRQGDVIIIRSGFTGALSKMSGDEQVKAMSSHRVCGVEGTEEAAKWFWNKHFAAVAGDMIAFEQIPPIINGKEGEIKDLVLHQYFISLFGLYIGELWDLEALSEHCAKTGRYTFMLTSIPLNVPGQIGSPPNAIAVF